MGLGIPHLQIMIMLESNPLKSIMLVRGLGVLGLTRTRDRKSLHDACDTGVCEQISPFTRAFALQASGRNCSPAPDLVLFRLTFPRFLLSGGVFFSQTPVLGKQNMWDGKWETAQMCVK